MILCDASPLVSLVNRKDPHHPRCVAALPKLSSPLLTTWPCFTEAMYLLYRYAGWPGQQELWDYITNKFLIIHFNTESEQRRMQELMERYRDIPMDLSLDLSPSPVGVRFTEGFTSNKSEPSDPRTSPSSSFHDPPLHQQTFQTRDRGWFI